jgi:demethylmenaquinone methyltransferase/2-methoxy-6-polyprenyl-1,4-benzoquinol methylase
MNRIMTFGLDAGWRRAAVALAQPMGAVVLDVGTGTGDFALALRGAGARQVIGIDFVQEMLVVAQRKADNRVDGGISWANADAMVLPFQDARFDSVTNAFVLRNVANLPAAVAEMVRVLRPGGRLVCLEITHPPKWLRPAFGLYFGRVVPIIGALFTGEGNAYQYLPASLAPLPEASRLAEILRDAGLGDVTYRRLGFGTVAVHVGTRGPTTA